jgi:nucleoside diphosphate kinase
MKRKKISTLLQTGSIAFFGYTDDEKISILQEKKAGTMHFYMKEDELNGETSSSHNRRGYTSYYDIRHIESDVCFLDGDAVRVMLVGCPSCPDVFFIRLRINVSLFWAVIGLIRRIVVGDLYIVKLMMSSASGRSQLWLVVRKRNEHNVFRGTNGLSKEVGIAGFLKYLTDEHVEYIVLRNFSSLPQLHRKGGDLDVLVSDDDVKKVRLFIANNPGDVPIDVCSESGREFLDMPCYPPHLANRLLQSSLVHESTALVPEPKLHMLSLIYHAIYHKGVLSGIPSERHDIRTTSLPTNDYLRDIQVLATQLNIDVGDTIESMDIFMEQEGWRPKLDTLAKLSEANIWIKKHFFSTPIQNDELCLGAIVCREAAMRDGYFEPISKRIEENGFYIVRKKIFSDEEKKLASQRLRGGNWAEALVDMDIVHPAAVFVITDLVMLRRSNPRPSERLKRLKQIIRKDFSHSGVNAVHSTDTTPEAVEYIEELFPLDNQVILDEVRDIKNSRKKPSLSVKQRVDLVHQDLSFHYVHLMKKIKNSFIDKILN